MVVALAHHERLRFLEAYEFEMFVAELWSHRGWETEVTQQAVDKGIDVIATRHEPFQEKQVIQAKRYDEGNNVSSTEIQQYSSLRHQESSADTVIVIATSGFTPQARELAENLNVKLLDGESLSRLIDDVGAANLVEKYAGSATESHVRPSESTSVETSLAEEDDGEMSTGDAIISVLQLLLILGVLGYVAFEVATILFL